MGKETPKSKTPKNRRVARNNKPSSVDLPDRPGPETSQKNKTDSRIDKKNKQSLEEVESPPRNKQPVRRQAKSTEAEKNLTKALVAINIAFIVLVLPCIVTHSVYILYYLSTENRGTVYYKIHIAWQILYLIETLNYSINLFLYIWYSPMFRKSLFSLVACRCCRINCKTPNQL